MARPRHRAWNGSDTPTVRRRRVAMADHGEPMAGPDVRSTSGTGRRGSTARRRDQRLRGAHFLHRIMSLRSRQRIRNMRLVATPARRHLVTPQRLGHRRTGRQQQPTPARTQRLRQQRDGIDVTFGARGTTVRNNNLTVEAGRAASSASTRQRQRRARWKTGSKALIGLQWMERHKLTANVARNKRVGVMQTAGGSKVNSPVRNLVYANGAEIPGQGNCPAST